ncbi:hypothetical protein D0469_13130 [Peribacillus saganii]|uniref:DUF2268 domain-containing protein n=1 Tax=Peribacillus saganii TaxID=2303992 RepID=A0A372LLZ7_9BACI|nr:DUF2268 domain-containing putative Zn-dependent protease [Peribacillus saganii]RFU68030.1 hypothetical protein D0469_13130 [Peribacillus saganii]
MAVINTFEWLKKEVVTQEEVCGHFRELLNEENPRRLYAYLRNYGMYIEGYGIKSRLEGLLKKNVWGKISEYLKSYQEKWKGPDVPVFIFPLQPKGLFSRRTEDKSGLAFKDKLFLFINPGIPEKELEALFVHEYHHVCRLNKSKKREEDFTLLDAMVLEGLAEQAVETYVGPAYLARWTSLYSDRTVRKLYERYLKDHINIKKNDSMHDELLYGANGKPFMLGYCTGYRIVNSCKEIKGLDSFQTLAEVYLKNFNQHNT